MAEGELKMQISLEKYEEMQDRIANLETAIETKSKVVDILIDTVVKRDKEIDSLRAKQPHWISVKDSLPEVDEGYVLVCSEFGSIGFASIDADGNWHGEYQDVAYWMPLPEPPEVEDNEAD